MDTLYFGGKLFYQDGWFVYARDNKEVCVLTRDDARMVEDSYKDYRRYEAGVTGMQRMVEGVVPFEEYGIRRYSSHSGEYEVDKLAPASSDVKICGVLEIPQRVGDYTINNVLENSFKRLRIFKLVLPKTIKKVGKNAFDDCELLSQIIMERPFPNIHRAFNNCRSMRYLNGFFRIGGVILRGDPNLKGHVIIPEGVEEIMAGAFEGNRHITSVSFPSTIKKIDMSAFRNDENLSRIIFTERLDELVIGEYAFCYCEALDKVVLPEGLTELKEGAFAFCKSLFEVKIPSTVTKIWRRVFEKTKMESDYLASGDVAFYVDTWLVDIKQKIMDELRIKEGTVGVAAWAAHRPRHGRIGKVILASTVKYLNIGALSDTADEEIDLKNVEVIEDYALEGVYVQTLCVPATCKVFGASLFEEKAWEDVYFYNPETYFKTNVRIFGKKSPKRVHGYEGSTIQELCELEGARYNITFVPIK